MLVSKGKLKSAELFVDGVKVLEISSMPQQSPAKEKSNSPEFQELKIGSREPIVDDSVSIRSGSGKGKRLFI